MFNLKAQHGATQNIEEPSLIHIKTNFRPKRILDTLINFLKKIPKRGFR